MPRSKAQEDTIKGIKNLMNARSNEFTGKRPAKCKVVYPEHMNIITEQYYYISSRTNYDHLMIVSGLKRREPYNHIYVIDRVIHEREYFLEDCTFPFYHNMLTVDMEDKDKLHVEVNFNYAIPHIIYASLNRIYDHQVFLNNYTEKEFFILIDLFTSLVLDIISEDEFNYLIELMERDSVLTDFINNLRSSLLVHNNNKHNNIVLVTDYQGFSCDKEKMYGYVKKSDLHSLMNTYINHKMTTLLPFIENTIKNKTQFCQLKAVHDYRFIFVLTNYEYINPIGSIYNIDLKYNKETSQLRLIAELLSLNIPIRCGNNIKESVIEPKYYIGSQALDEVKTFALEL